MDIWSEIGGRIKPRPLQGELRRLVESQEQVATLGLVDNLEEQAILEDLLETAKPPHRPGCAGLHYLLATPFRYPPLEYGSRFGSRYEPSLFYGSLQVTTVLAETAFYRFTFWFGMSATPPSGRLVTQHTLFTAGYRSAAGLRLHEPPFDEYRALLTDPQDYGATQRLGQAMREAGVGAFEYLSARDPDKGINVALFGPEGLAHRQPSSQQSWLCETSSEAVNFSSAMSGELYRFPLATFLLAGRLPRAAG